MLIEEIPIEYGNEIDVFKEKDILSTGDERLDEFLSLQRGIPTMIAGPAYTGKTTLAISLSLETLLKGGRVFYVDSEYGVIGSRVAQMCNVRRMSLDLVKRRMRILRINELNELSKYLKYACAEYDLVVIDSISRLILKSSRASTNNLESLERLIAKAYGILCECVATLAERNRTLVVVNEIIPKAESGEAFYTLKVSLARLAVLTKIIVCMIMKEGKRFLYLERHPFKASVYEEPVFIEYRITGKGLEYVGKAYVKKGVVRYHVDIY